MSGDLRPGRGPDPAEDDVVVPHPFGSGALGEGPPPGAPEDPGRAPEGAGRAPDDAGQAPDDAGQAPEPDDRAEAVQPPGPRDAEATETQEPGSSAEPPAGASTAEPTDAPSAEVPPAVEPAPGEEEPAAVPTRRRTRDPLAAALIGVLTLLLGFAFAVQVRSVGDDQEYAGAREEDLVRILDELNAREARLRDQIADQRSALQQLTSSDSQQAAALDEARARAEAIGILNGTIAAQGPGLVMTVRDAGDEVRVSDVVDAIQELRGAGAETMQIDGVRVGVSTAVTGTPGNLMVDGRPITSPYEFVVIGSPQNMETALNIPGGVAQDLTRLGASIDIEQSDQVVVDALRPLDTPQYASPDTGG